MSDGSDPVRKGRAPGEHVYDGIVERDNPIPIWLTRAFVCSILFGGFYALGIHMGLVSTVAQSYLDEMAAFREWETSRRLGDSVTEDGLASLMEDKGLMEDASHIYSASCVKCHGVKGEGKIGPNLTDAHWLRGSGSLLDIYNLVNKGGPNGMPAWGRKLRPIQLQKVVAFVGSMRFTMVPGKAPQGTRVEFRSEAPAETDTPEAEGGGETEAMPTVVRANPERGEGGSEQGARRQGRAKR